jgi:ATP/ADP translocase
VLFSLSFLICLVCAIGSANSEPVDTSSDHYDRLMTELVTSGETARFASCFSLVLKAKGYSGEKISALLTHYKGETLVRTLKETATTPFMICRLDAWVIGTVLSVFFVLIVFSCIGFCCCVRWMCRCQKNQSVSITLPNTKRSSRSDRARSSEGLTESKRATRAARKSNGATASAYV